MQKTEDFIKPQTTYGDTLRFTAYAWSKFLYMQERGDTEIAGYCITSTEDPLLVTDFKLIKQRCTSVSFDLDEQDMAEYQEEMLDAGLAVWQSSRILAHTHPGCSTTPSNTDENNFIKAFSRPNWAIMLILAQDGSTYCRLKINTAPGIEKLLKVQVDFTREFKESNHTEWNTEYTNKVKEIKFRMTGKEKVVSSSAVGSPLDDFPDSDKPLWRRDKEDELIGFNQIKEEESICDEIDCYWEGNGYATYWSEEHDAWFFYDPIKEVWYTESLEDELEENEFVEVVPPNENWVVQVVAWAVKYAPERTLSMEEV